MASEVEFSDTASTSIYWDDEEEEEEEFLDFISTNSSFGSIEQEFHVGHDHPFSSSDELDRLSQCLTISEASSDSREASTSLFYDVIQAQVALWTCVFSLLYSYAWRQHRKKFIMSIFLIVPTVFTASCVISGLLTTIVVLGRLFSTPYTYTDFINLKDKILPTEQEDGAVGRKRTLSGASTISWHSEQDLLPRPLCRRHSASNGSVNNASRPPSRKLSYCYSHFSAENGIEQQKAE